MGKKPTRTFGHIAFGRDGRARPVRRRLSDIKCEQETSVATDFVHLGRPHIGDGLHIAPLSERDNDFALFRGDHLVAEVECTEIALHEFIIEKTEQEWVDSAPGQEWMRTGPGKYGMVDAVAHDTILVRKIDHKRDKYSKPEGYELWLLIWSVSSFPIGNFIRAGKHEVSSPVARARDYLEESGAGPFSRIFYFDLQTTPTLIWPIEGGS